MRDTGEMAFVQAKVGREEFKKRELVSKKIYPLAELMTNPPLVTLGENGAASGITNSTLHLAANFSTGVLNTNFRFNGDVIRAGSNFPDNNFVKDISVTTTQSTGNIVVDFAHYGQSFELYEKGQAGKYRILVDEGYGFRAVTPFAQDAAPSSGGTYNRLVSFTAKAHRNIRVEYSSTFFGGVRIGPNDSIMPTTAPPLKDLTIFGDSYAEGGSSGGAVTHGYGAVTGRLLGLNYKLSGVGATGYENDGTSGRVNFQGRVLNDIVKFKPNAVIVAGGINDENYLLEDIRAAADLLYKTILEGVPGVELIVVSNWSPTGNHPTKRLEIRNTLRDVALKYKLPFIDVLEGNTYNHDGVLITKNTGSWITGVGNAGNPQATGNASVFISSDATHPTREGHEYLGRRLAAEIYKIYN